MGEYAIVPSRQLLALFMLICLVMPAGVALADVKRHAVIVGVNAYPEVRARSAYPPHESVALNLSNPETDANAVAKALISLDFASQRLLLSSNGEARRGTIEAAWAETLEAAAPGDVVLFYFAGHGFELHGQNFLIPQDASYESTAKYRLPVLTKSSIAFSSIYGALGEAQKKKPGIMGIFILDACRENPFRQDERIDESIPVGLKAVLPPQDMFIMYSAGIQQRALDGPKGENSIYAKHLLQLIAERRDWPLSMIAQTLRLDVYQYAKNKNHLQTPAYYDQLSSSRSLMGATSKLVTPPDNSRLEATFRGLGDSEVIIDCTYCPEAVSLPVQSFKMGSTVKGQTEVNFPTRFAVGKFEVTNREWNACVRAGPCRGEQKNDASESYRERLPVTGVSWNDAQDFVAWLSKETGQRYRLPTDAEWEYAARAGTETDYFFGAAAADLCDYANGADQRMGALVNTNQACDDQVGRHVAPVGLYRPNKFGLFDVHGNVWEWVQDCWHPGLERLSKTPSGKTDGSKAWELPKDQGVCSSRVARGGSWRSGPYALRSAARNAFPPLHSRATLGFRVVRELSGGAAQK